MRRRDLLYRASAASLAHVRLTMVRSGDAPPPTSAAIYKQIEMMSRPERIVTREGHSPMFAPALKIREFHFTSVSTFA